MCTEDRRGFPCHQKHALRLYSLWIYVLSSHHSGPQSWVSLGPFSFVLCRDVRFLFSSLAHLHLRVRASRGFPGRLRGGLVNNALKRRIGSRAEVVRKMETVIRCACGGKKYETPAGKRRVPKTKRKKNDTEEIQVWLMDEEDDAKSTGDQAETRTKSGLSVHLT